MMKLHSLQPWRCYCNSRILRPLFYSTSGSTSFRSPEDSLYLRVSQAGDPRISIVSVLDQWVEEGREVKQSDLQKLIKQLRRFRRFNHALQLCEWISNERNQEPSPGDIAIQLHLISKVHGLEQAEKYFNSIRESSRDYKVYGALLNCYVEDKNLEKAEALMEKMRELGFLKTPLPYNTMFGLYAHLGKHEKLDELIEEMEEMGIARDRFTYNIRMNAYAANSDVTNMEKLLLKMEADPLISMDWHGYFVVANGYFKAGLSDKSLLMLKRSEHLIGDKQRWFAYECLITLYAAIGNKDQVYRVWNLYANLKRRYNTGYLCIISSLMKLDDIEGAEEILKEWELGDTCFDFKIPNMMVNSYCKKGLVDKAEAYINRLMENGKEPQANTWDRLATGYHANGQTMKAVEAMKKAISASPPGWKPNYYTLAACLEYLKTNGNVEAAEEIVRLLGKHNIISSHINDRLVDYIHSDNQTSSALHQFGLDGHIERIDHASDLNKLNFAEVLKNEETSDMK
ncbi:pentatricopeptide repeat-containing protein At2g20710, mitochondrial-like [Cucurbita pepo subsp. pepo]|uniref:pentatricopeptide repeat-containing protein At2g20710, mitochondrial-like n=1 Tax=Cucurbita pepo subsp. pepo TaxID=3664 RepID=UPI000C9D3E61|nr:pentatricopeptide repeat-containing protein At2g20710, mitochondrial-like [Cucurbita pepo subsp. pepo]